MRSTFLVWLLPIVLVGCGYSPKYDTPGGMTSVAVSVFRNNTLYSGVELDLTDALIKEIASKTPLHIRKIARADARFEGSLEDYGLSVLREDEDGIVSEYQLRATVNYKLISLSTQQVLREGRDVGWELSYVPKFGETELQARQELLKNLARKIVCRTFEVW